MPVKLKGNPQYLFVRNAFPSLKTIVIIASIVMTAGAGGLVLASSTGFLKKIFAWAVDKPILKENAFIQYRVGMNLLQDEEFEPAFDRFERLIQNHPGFAPGYYGRGILYRIMGHENAALQDFESALKLDPQYADAYYERGVMNKKRGLGEKASQDLDMAIKLSPEMSVAYNARGEIYQRQGRLQAALSDFEQALSLDPQFWEAYKNKVSAIGKSSDKTNTN